MIQMIQRFQCITGVCEVLFLFYKRHIISPEQQLDKPQTEEGEILASCFDTAGGTPPLHLCEAPAVSRASMADCFFAVSLCCRTGR